MRSRILAVLAICLATAAHGAMDVTVERTIVRPADVGSRTATVLAWMTGSRGASLFDRPFAVAWDGDALLVADPGARRVVRIDGTRVTTTDEGLEQPVGVAACAQGIVVTDSVAGKVVVFDRNLRKSRILAQDIERPTGVACRGDEVFVVATGEHRIVVINAVTGLIRQIGARGEGPSLFNFPVALAMDQTTLFVGDTLNFRVQRIEALTGAFRGEFGGLGDGVADTPRIKGLAVDPDGRLWVSDAHLDRLSVYQPGGEFIGTVGGPGSEAGHFSFPAGIAVAADGRIAVADSLNRRIQILRVIGGAGR